jgi:general stress protein YciG
VRAGLQSHFETSVKFKAGSRIHRRFTLDQEPSVTDRIMKGRQGFASMDPTRRREIAQKGGQAAHQKGTAHRWTKEEAQRAGRMGGLAPRRPKPPEV